MFNKNNIQRSQTYTDVLVVQIYLLSDVEFYLVNIYIDRTFNKTFVWLEFFNSTMSFVMKVGTNETSLMISSRKNW